MTLYLYVPAAFYGAADPEELQAILRDQRHADRPWHLWQSLDLCLGNHGASWVDEECLEIDVPRENADDLIWDLEAMGCRVSR